ncbi:MAG: hypothetical protein ACTS8R_00890 [Arsenophonus sp. NC-QC1-MAG3]
MKFNSNIKEKSNSTVLSSKRKYGILVAKEDNDINCGEGDDDIFDRGGVEYTDRWQRKGYTNVAGFKQLESLL